jgi:NAD-specific glutamate dehydrogenase
VSASVLCYIDDIDSVVRHVLKTNFYQPTKVALSFRLAPDFLPDGEYPKEPFGMFFVIGMKPPVGNESG